MIYIKTICCAICKTYRAFTDNFHKIFDETFSDFEIEIEKLVENGSLFRFALPL